MKVINTIQVGDTVTYFFKEITYTGICLKHTKTIVTELVNNESTISYELNKYHIMINSLNLTLIIDDSDTELSIIDIKRKERLLI